MQQPISNCADNAALGSRADTNLIQASTIFALTVEIAAICRDEPSSSAFRSSTAIADQ
mgnify:CR=1 FL=1